MNLLRRSHLGLAAACLLAPLAHANSFERAAQHIDVDGSFFAFVEFDGDGQEIGLKLNQIYESVLAANPNITPIPIDFPSLFDTLGFGSVHSMAMSSKELADGQVRNASVTLLDGEPAGLMNLYGLDPIEFRAAQIAPADTTTALSGQIRVTALRDTIHALATQLLGPMGDGLVQQNLGNPLFGTDLTGNEIIEALSGQADLVMAQKLRPDGQPDIRFWASIAGAGALLPRLQSLSESLPITFADTPAGLTADLSALLGENAPFPLYVRAPSKGDSLEIYNQDGWVNATGGLTADPKFQRATAHLPKEAAMFSYSAGFDPEEVYKLLAQEASIAPYLPVIRQAVDLLLSDLIAPAAGAMYRDGDAIVSEQYADYSFKELLAVVPVGVGAAVAVPAIQQAMQKKVDVAVTNNLRQIADAGKSYLLYESVEEVTFAQLVNADYLDYLPSIKGESYEDIVITTETTEISVELPDGRVISYAF